jgi:chloramphenicol 3-O phosphotransferase
MTKSKKPGTIILLNGASSSGKSSLVKAVQAVFEEPYIDAGIDRFLWMLPERYLERPLWDQVLGLANQAGPVGHQLIAAMHQCILALSQSGINVVADHVLIEKSWLYECSDLFAAFPAYFVGVRCPLDVLEQRERARGNRTFGQARLQFPLVHAHEIYDLEVDTALNSPENCAMQIKNFILSGKTPTAFKRLTEGSNLT